MAHDNGGDSEYLVFAGDRSDLRGMSYSRSQAPIRRKLEMELCSLYGAKSTHGGHIFPSGMNAITGTMSALTDEHLINNNTNTPMMIVHGDELYCDVFRTVKRLVDIHGGRVKAEGVSIRDHAKLIKVFTDSEAAQCPVKIFHFEACTNPSSEVFDFSIIPKLRQISPSCAFICDNTWLTGWQLNPLQLGCDIVVESMTKYLSGGSCIGGHCVVPNALNNALRSWVATYGIFVGDDHCQMYLNGLYSLPARMSGHSQRITRLAKFLEELCGPSVIGKVLHPSRKSHPSRQLAVEYAQQMGQAESLCPGVMYVHIVASKNKVAKIAQGLKDGSILEMKTSFGGPGTRIDPWSIMKGMSDKYDMEIAGGSGGKKGGGGGDSSSSSGAVEGTWIRIAIGHSDSIEEVEAAFADFLSRATGKTVAGGGSGGDDGTEIPQSVAAAVSCSTTTGGGFQPPSSARKSPTPQAQGGGSTKEKGKKKSRLQ